MQPATKINIVTPSLNAAATIDRTISSVLTQSGDFELVYHVQDGGSTDGTVDALKKWQSLIDSGAMPLLCRAIAFSYESKRDEGPYDAITLGFRRQKMNADEWMGWINADDLLAPGTLALLAAIDATPSQRHMKWITGSPGVVRNDAFIPQEGYLLSSSILKEGLADGKYWKLLRQEGTFFRNVTWRNVDIEKQFRSLKFAGDWNLWRCMAQKYRLFQVERPLGLSRAHDDRASLQLDGRYAEEIGKFAPFSQRLRALKALAETKVEASILRQVWPSGEVAFSTQNLQEQLQGQIETWLGPRHNADWQFPAITEKAASDAVWAELPASEDIVYFAFPWATLIDQLQNKADSSAMLAVLDAAKRRLRSASRVVTVCQHIHMLTHRHLFERAGITDIFWSHAAHGMRLWPGRQVINLYPFPLYPVQVAEALPSEDGEQREHLFSFVGAASNTWYLSGTRNWIIQELAHDPRGVVIGRAEWHYNKIVYDHQIRKREAKPETLVDQEASEQFKRLLKASTFALCPSGSGPNSIRLWEAIGAGSIPVILADSYAPPGNMALWKEAAVFCPETEEAIQALPDQLEEMAADPAVLARKRQALRQLWMLYRPDNFIHDIRKFYFSVTTQNRAQAQPALSRPAVQTEPAKVRIGFLGRHANRTPLSYSPYEPFFRKNFQYTRHLEAADVLITGYDVDFRENGERIARIRAQNPNVKLAVVSEEPLWDTSWAKGFQEKTVTYADKGNQVSYACINHTNSDVFRFDNIPYFVTTNDEYLARYSYLFARNAQMSSRDLLDIWNNAAIAVAFFAEKRAGAAYEKIYTNQGIRGLSSFRSQVCELYDGEKVLRVGQGWGTAEKRQALADWHLDKLATLDGRSFIVSAVENTHQADYITEKLFDAFAARGLPLYYATKDHAVHRLIKGGFVNLVDKSPEEAVQLIRQVKPTIELAQAWLESQRDLAIRFSDPALVAAERARVAGRVTELLFAVADGEWPGLGAEQEKRAAKAEAVAKPVAAKIEATAKPLVPAARAEAKPVVAVATKTESKAAAAAAKAEAAAEVGGSAKAEAKAPAPAPAAKGAPAAGASTFRNAEIVEVYQSGNQYEHLNIMVNDFRFDDVKIKRIYFKIQKIDKGQYSLEFVPNEIEGNVSSDWKDQAGQAMQKVNVFFNFAAPGNNVSWSTTPAPEVKTIVVKTARKIHDILKHCERTGDGKPLGEWTRAADAVSAIDL